MFHLGTILKLKPPHPLSEYYFPKVPRNHHYTTVGFKGSGVEPEHPEALGSSFQGVGTSSVDFRVRDNFPHTHLNPQGTQNSTTLHSE